MQRFLDRRVLILILILAYMGPVRELMSGGPAALGSWIADTLITIPAIIIGLSFHEYAHAIVAYRCGDPTPRIQGRCTVEPRAHIDPTGMLTLLFIGFGWGRPVMVNPSNFKSRRRDSILVGLAGVTMNLIVAVAFGGIIKLMFTLAPGVMVSGLGNTMFMMLYYVVVINISLMLFNLLPVPPLDGFGVISDIFGLEGTAFHNFVYRNSMVILLVLIILDVPSMLLSRPLAVIVDFILSGIYGIF